MWDGQVAVDAAVAEEQSRAAGRGRHVGQRQAREGVRAEQSRAAGRVKHVAQSKQGKAYKQSSAPAV